MKIDKSDRLPIRHQCKLLDISRSTVYNKPLTRAIDPDLPVMKEMDKLHLQFPFMGSRRLKYELRDLGFYRINRKKVQRLIRKMGIRATVPQPNTSKPCKQHKIYPYLLRDLKINRPNQVWATDITYIPMPRGFVYLTVVMDWFSRKALSWRLSTTLDADFCIEALQEAIEKYGTPDIFNTDQGSQFTGEAFTNVLKGAGIKISMDGKGRWMDNVFIERLWRSLKYEEVYLKAYQTVAEAEAGINTWLEFYNQLRKHQSLGYLTPDQVYSCFPNYEAA